MNLERPKSVSFIRGVGREARWERGVRWEVG